jgi:hypothetical protein
LSYSARARLGGVRSWVPVTAAIAGTLLYSWFAAALRPFTWPENVAVALPVLVVLARLVAGWRRPAEKGSRSTDPERARSERPAGATWIGLVAVLLAWELTAYFSSPRQDHPTLSTVADDIMTSHPGRAAMFALWLVLGWLLFVRSPAGQP